MINILIIPYTHINRTRLLWLYFDEMDTLLFVKTTADCPPDKIRKRFNVNDDFRIIYKPDYEFWGGEIYT